MPFNAWSSPGSKPGPTPVSFTVEISGGASPYTLSAAPSPPNPDPMPAWSKTGTGPWYVTVTGETDPDTELFFVARDDNEDSADVSFRVT